MHLNWRSEALPISKRLRIPGASTKPTSRSKALGWTYLYRAVGSLGDRLDFFLRMTRDAQAAKHFFCKVLAAPHTVSPRVITVDKNAAYPKAFKELKAEGNLPQDCELRRVQPWDMVENSASPL
jgi:transposase-like protein